jgi:hypothetical protein
LFTYMPVLPLTIEEIGVAAAAGIRGDGGHGGD